MQRNIFLVALTHASLRMRNMKNKIANQAEAAGVTKTVMGRILDELGMKPEVIRVEWKGQVDSVFLCKLSISQWIPVYSDLYLFDSDLIQIVPFDVFFLFLSFLSIGIMNCD